ncbi:MAG: hypothetical protein V7K54_18565 [Nostoc sp.]
MKISDSFLCALCAAVASLSQGETLREQVGEPQGRTALPLRLIYFYK